MKLAAAVALFMVVPLWIVEFPPIQDLPNHLGRVHVMLDLLSSGEAFGDDYELSLLPLPNVAADIVLLPLVAAFPAEVAGKIYLSFVLFFGVAAGFRFLRAVGAPEMGWLALPLGWNWFVHMGFLSFVLSVPLALFALAWHREHEEGFTPRGRVVFMLLATATYLAHLSSFAMLVAIIQLRKWRRGGVRGLFRLDPGFLPGFLLFVGVSLGERGGAGYVAWGWPEWKLWNLANLFRAYQPAGDLALFALCVAGVVFATKRVRRARLPAVWAALALFILLPRSAMNGYWVDARVLPFLAFLVLAAVRADAVRARRFGVLLAVLVTVWTGWQYARVGPTIGRWVHAAEVVPVGATILPVSEKAAEGQIEVYHHAVTWLVSRRDVVTPHLFAKRFQHPVRPRRERPTLHEFWFKGEGGKRPDLRTLATVWRYAWLTGDEAFDAEIEALGRRIATAGDLRIIELHEP